MKDLNSRNVSTITATTRSEISFDTATSSKIPASKKRQRSKIIRAK